MQCSLVICHLISVIPHVNASLLYSEEQKTLMGIERERGSIEIQDTRFDKCLILNEFRKI